MQTVRKRKRLRRRRGMSMVELIGVMIVIAILATVAGLSISRNVKRSNREAVVNELQIYSTSLSDAYYDLGAPKIDPTATDAENAFKRWAGQVQEGYLSVQFDWTTLEATDNGFKVDGATPLDVYEQPYHFWFVTSPDLMPYAMVASGGEDGIVDFAGYASKNYADDIVLVVRPRT